MHFSIFTMSDMIQQRSALRMLRNAFGNSTMSQKNVYKWYKDGQKLFRSQLTGQLTDFLLKVHCKYNGQNKAVCQMYLDVF